MRYPYVIAVWKASLIEGLQFINDWGFGENLIQIIPEARGAWYLLRVTGDQKAALLNYGAEQTPKWGFMP